MHHRRGRNCGLKALRLHPLFECANDAAGEIVEQGPNIELQLRHVLIRDHDEVLEHDVLLILERLDGEAPAGDDALILIFQERILSIPCGDIPFLGTMKDGNDGVDFSIGLKFVVRGDGIILLYKLKPEFSFLPIVVFKRTCS